MRSTAVVSGMTLLSRVLGFVRDVVLARSFGASAATDAFYVALRIPNLMRRLFAEGSFSLAFVPVLNESKTRDGPEALRALIDAVTGTLLGVLLAVVGVGMVLSPAFVAVFAPGFIDDPAQFDLAAGMLRITFPYALLISLTALAGGILNSHGRFAIPAFTPVLLNLAMIAAALWLAPRMDEPVVALAWGVLVAGVIQLLFQVPPLMRLGLLPRPRFDWHHDGVRKIMRLMLPTLFGSSVAQVNVLVDTLIASLITVGSITWLFYSDRLLEFPLGVFGIAISTVLLPSLSRVHASGDSEAFQRALDWGLRVGALIALPAAVGLAALAVPIITTLFNYGAFDQHDVAMTAASVIAYSFGLPAHVTVKVLAPGYYARQNTREPVRAAVVAMVSNMVLNALFVWALVNWPVAPAHAGLAAASTVSAYLNAGLLYRGLRRQGVLAFAPGWARHLAATGFGSVAMGAVVLWQAGAGADWAALGVTDRALNLAVLLVLGVAVYGVCLLAFRLPLRALRDFAH